MRYNPTSLFIRLMDVFWDLSLLGATVGDFCWSQCGTAGSRQEHSLPPAPRNSMWPRLRQPSRRTRHSIIFIWSRPI